MGFKDMARDEKAMVMQIGCKAFPHKHTKSFRRALNMQTGVMGEGGKVVVMCRLVEIFRHTVKTIYSCDWFSN